MKPEPECDPRLIEQLDFLRISPVRNPENAQIGRASFLQEAQDFSGAVSLPVKRRHNGWMHALQSIFKVQKKEQSPMISTLATIILIVSFVLGGGGVTVAAAQSSQPDQPLYSVKVLSEDARMGLVVDPQSEYQLALQFADRREAEIRTMLVAGSIPPESVQTRYQDQVDQAIQFAINLPDDQATLALQQIQARLQTQQQALDQVQLNRSPDVDAALLRTQQMLKDRLQLVEAGLIDPVHLRDQLHLHDQQRTQDRQTMTSPAGQSTKLSSGTGNGNPWTTGTPTPGSGYGPGDGTGDCATCTPIGKSQAGNPWTTGTPVPGSGYGPGPGPDPTRSCTPGSGSGSALQPAQPQNNQPDQAGPQQKNQPDQDGSGPSEKPQSNPSGSGNKGGKH
jgi:hypothetical protein